MARLADLPVELLYEVVAEIVGEYVDRAITCEPVALREQAAPKLAPSSECVEPEDDDDDGDSTDDPNYDQWDLSPRAQSRCRRALRKWEKKDRSEKLPPNNIKPLLAVYHNLREVTLKVLCDAFGMRRTTEGSLRHSPWSIIWRMRRHYRIGRTGPSDEWIVSADRRSHNTDFYNAYYALSDFGFAMRDMADIVRDTHEKFESTRLDIWDDMFMHKNSVDSIGHSALRRRVARRAFVLRAWLANAFSIGKLIRYLLSTVYWMDTYSQQQEWIKFAQQSNNFLLIFEELARQMKNNYDEVDYPGLPGPLVEAVGIRQVLRDTLKVIASFPRCGPENEDVTKAVEIVKRVTPQWDELAKSSFYIDVL